MQHQDNPFIDRIVALHGITLRMADQFEEAVIYRIAVEEGLAQLDFDRLAIFLLDENRLRQLNEELEGRVVARTRALAEANHQLPVETMSPYA